MSETLGARHIGLAIGLALVAATTATAQTHSQTSPPSMSAGQRVAQRSCGGCHAVSGASSPLPNAPPFATLYLRYRPGHLDEILSEGMLAPSRMPEEGSPRTHPRMPMTQLDDDQVADLKAYLRGLDPRPASGPDHPR
ncbi:MAG: cytochrome c [bacterium]|nr:cytochrome c [bacterium]